MRPLTLALEHFGPYVRHTVDFSPFRHEPLVLVHGDTGAGKSTLLDAMAWALYGRGLGARSDPEHLRDRSASPDAATRVTFTFALGNRTFSLQRTMGFERPAKRGGGVTQHPPEALLTCVAGDPSYTPVSTPTRCNAEVERLVGLSYEQFVRIVVLPQGEFREFLLAGAKDRERLLEHLFGTALYTAVEVELREMAKTLEAESKHVDARIEDALRSVRAVSREALTETRAALCATLEAHRSKIRLAEDKLQAIDARLAELRARHARNADRAALRDEQRRLDDTRAMAEAVARRLDAADRAAICEGDLVRVTEARRREDSAARAREASVAALRSAEAMLDDPALSLTTLNELAQRREALRERRNRIEHLRDDAILLAEESRALDRARSVIETRTAERATLDAQLARLAAEASTLAARIEEGRRAARDEAAAVLRVETVDRRRQALAQRRERRREAEAVARSLRTAERNVTTARERVERLRDALDEVRKRERDGLAATLAALLVHGTPCPVCGSVEHPAPAQPPPGSATEADVQEAERRLDVAREKLTEAEQEVARLQGEFDALVQTLEAEPDDADEGALEAAHAEAKRHLDEIRSTKRAGEDAERSLARQMQEARNIEALRSETDRVLAEATATVAQLTPRIDALQANFMKEGIAADALETLLATTLEEEEQVARTLREKARQRDAAEAQRAGALIACDRAKAEHEEARRAREAAEAALTAKLTAEGFETEAACREATMDPTARAALRTEVTERRAKEATVAAQREALGEDEPTDELAALEQQVAQWRAEAAAAQRELGALSERRATLDDVNARVTALTEEAEETARRLRTIRRVADLANGRHEGKTRLSRYVLLERFDRVVACASARLERMSDGRFTLRRQASRHTGGEFDLSVEDVYAGAKGRSVATLSGGEMFLASLAMALGLSDVVQAWAGGVRVESLFVDEGFGTLDEEALDKAVSVLEAIGEHRRMVGVVSHVPELRKRIPARLEVLRTERGSVTRASIRGRARDPSAG